VNRESPGVALEMRGVTKRFGELLALDGVDFTVRSGTVHALLGENGAGKSTLMKVAFGLTTADAGSLALSGAVRRTPTPRAAMAAGLGMVHQHLSLAPALRSEENLVLGGSGAYSPAAATERLRQVSADSRLEVPAGVATGALSIVAQQRLEILKALACGARVLILDEPTAVLAPSETAELLAWIRRFADGGGSVVLVTHKLRDALAVADDVTVLRRGRVVFKGAAGETSEEALSRALFAEAPMTRSTVPRSEAGEVVVELRNVTARHGALAIRQASLTVRRREILGVAAVENSGHRALLGVLAGLAPVEAGTATLPATRALIPADRLRDALIADFTLVENVALRGAGQAHGLMDWRALAGRTARLVARFNIAAGSGSAMAGSLSGGNQQRLVVARALETPVDLLVADNPTRGLDLVATSFVHDQLRSAAAGGSAVVVHSSDVDEVLALATRVIVVFSGAIVECPVDRETVARAMVGARSAA